MDPAAPAAALSFPEGLFDTHCHLDDPRLRERLPEVLQTAAAAGVSRYLLPSVKPEKWAEILDLSRKYDPVFAAFGVHPMHADLLDDAALKELTRLAPQGVAIGEIGLDYAMPTPSKDQQRRAFRAQLQVARQFQLPVLLHCRKAFADLLEILSEGGLLLGGGVMHAFSGSVETARECLKMGLHISICGTVTFSDAVRPVAVAREIPLDRLLLETDSPDLSPAPHRGGVNEPSYLVDTANKVAAVRGMTIKELTDATTANALQLLRL